MVRTIVLQEVEVNIPKNIFRISLHNLQDEDLGESVCDQHIGIPGQYFTLLIFSSYEKAQAVQQQIMVDREGRWNGEIAEELFEETVDDRLQRLRLDYESPENPGQVFYVMLSD